MTEAELKAGTRNAEVYVYEEPDGGCFISIEMPGLTAEYPIGERVAIEMANDMVDGETIKKRERRGDW